MGYQILHKIYTASAFFCPHTANLGLPYAKLCLLLVIFQSYTVFIQDMPWGENDITLEVIEREVETCAQHIHVEEIRYIGIGIGIHKYP